MFGSESDELASKSAYVFPASMSVIDTSVPDLQDVVAIVMLRTPSAARCWDWRVGEHDSPVTN